MATNHARWLLAALPALLGEIACAQTSAPGLQASLLLASDYKQYGLSQTDSDPVLRFAADYEHTTGFFAGGSVANAEYAAEAGYRSPRDSQANLYVGYLWRGSRWSSNASVSRYVYPGASPRYDYSDLSANVSYRNRYFLSYSRSDDYYFSRQRAYQYRAGVALPWIRDIEVGINAGEFHTRGLFDTHYTFWDIGVSRIVGRFALDLRYHDDTYDRTTVIGASGDDRWVLSISYAITVRDRGPAPR